MIRILALLIALSLALTSCGGRQLEEELLVIVLTVDQTAAGGIQLAVKVPGNHSEEKSGADGGSQTGYLLLKASGDAFYDAYALLNATTPRKLNFSQVREIVIGEKAAQSRDFFMLLRQIDALPRFRCSATVIVCRGEAWAFADTQKPYVGARLSRYAEMSLSNYAGKGFTPDTDLCRGVRDMGCGFQDPLFVLGAVNEFSGQRPDQENNVLDDLPGALPRKSDNPIEVFGAAATDGQAVSGYLTGYETALVNLLRGHVESLILCQQESIPLAVFPKRPASLSVDFSAQSAVLRVSVCCEIRYSPGCPPDEDALAQTIARDVTKVIRHLQALRCDGLGFGCSAVRSFLTVQAWEALHWRDLYAEAQVEVAVTLQCREG